MHYIISVQWLQPAGRPHGAEYFNSSAAQEISPLLWNTKVRYRV